jgi:hypothetical protein
MIKEITTSGNGHKGHTRTSPPTVIYLPTGGHTLLCDQRAKNVDQW